MKIKISKSQWELLKFSQLERLPSSEMEFFKSLPKEIQDDILKTIRSEKPPLSEIQKFLQHLQHLRKTEKKIFEKTPAPTIEKINEIIQRIQMTSPLDPAIDKLENLKKITIEMDEMLLGNELANRKAIDQILDRFSQGEITKEQLELSLKEFSKNKNMKMKLSKKEWDGLNKKSDIEGITKDDPRLSPKMKETIEKIEAFSIIKNIDFTTVSNICIIEFEPTSNSKALYPENLIALRINAVWALQQNRFRVSLWDVA